MIGQLVMRFRAALLGDEVSQEEIERTGAQLAGANCCPICAKPLQVVTCDACHGWPLGYCHHCGGLGKKTICTNQKWHKAD